MSDIFDFVEGEKQKNDVYTVMGKAIRKYFNDDENKITSGLARTISKIIDQGFLDSVLEEQVELVKYEKRRAENMKEKANEEEAHYNYQKAQACTLDNKIREMRNQLEEYRRIVEKESEGDTDLENAKRAFLWMYSETEDKSLASKAFNSYLLGKAERSIQATKERLHKRIVGKLKDELIKGIIDESEDDLDDDEWIEL